MVFTGNAYSGNLVLQNYRNSSQSFLNLYQDFMPTNPLKTSFSPIPKNLMLANTKSIWYSSAHDTITLYSFLNTFFIGFQVSYSPNSPLCIHIAPSHRSLSCFLLDSLKHVSQNEIIIAIFSFIITPLDY